MLGLNGEITFEMSRFNPRRKMRGARAASVIIKEGGEPIDCVWMNQSDIRKNIAEFGEDPGLLAAREAYKA